MTKCKGCMHHEPGWCKLWGTRRHGGSNIPGFTECFWPRGKPVTPEQEEWQVRLVEGGFIGRRRGHRRRGA